LALVALIGGAGFGLLRWRGRARGPDIEPHDGGSIEAELQEMIAEERARAQADEVRAR
jgi:hypothetical protein